MKRCTATQSLKLHAKRGHKLGFAPRDWKDKKPQRRRDCGLITVLKAHGLPQQFAMHRASGLMQGVVAVQRA